MYGLTADANMAQKNVVAPRLPAAPEAYTRTYQDQLTNLLRLYFNQLDNSSPINISTQRTGGAVVAALSAPPTPGTSAPSLPTQADLTDLRVGDVYYDTLHYNVMRMKSGSGDDVIPSPYPLIWLNM